MKALDLRRKAFWLVLLGGVAAVTLLSFVLWKRSSGLRTVEPAGLHELPPLALTETGDRPGLSGTPRARVPAVSSPRPESRVPTPTPTMVSDQERLSAIAANWVYRTYGGIGEQRTGKFTRQTDRDVEYFTAALGDVVEGVKIEKLDQYAAVVSLGSATTLLPLTPEPWIMFSERARNPEIPTEDEVKAAMTAYHENYGKRFAEMAKRYTPKPGEIMPPAQPPSPEEKATARARYLATWAPYFEKSRALGTPLPPGLFGERPTMSPEERQKAIEEYYRKYRPWATPPPDSMR